MSTSEPGDQGQTDPLEAPESAGAHSPDDHCHRQQDRRDLGKAEIADRKRDANELGRDRQGVQNEKVDDAERAPEAPEPLED